MNLLTVLKDPTTCYVDVRTPEEYQQGHIAGAINVPLHLLPFRLAELQEKQSPLVVYCLSGGRSYQAMQFLQQNGIAQVYNGGGIYELQEQLPVLS